MRLIFLIASLLGCGEESLPVDISGVEYDVGFVVLYPAGEGQPIRVTPAFGPAFGERPALTLEAQEQRFVFVAMRQDDLPPSFVAGRMAETDAVLEEPPPRLLFEGTETTERIRARLRVPAAAQLLTADLDADRTLRSIQEGEFDFFDRVTLRLPIDPEYCQPPGDPVLRPFAATANPIRTLLPSYGAAFRSAVWVDDDRVVINAFHTLFLLRRGEPITSTTTAPRGVWRIEDASTHRPRDSIRSLAVGPERADGTFEIIGVGGEGLPEGEDRPEAWGRVYFLQLDGDRFSETRPAIRTPDELYRSAAFTPDGKLWLGGRGGRIYQRPTETASVVLMTTLPVRDVLDPTYRLHPTQDAEFPLMGSTKARVHVRDSAWSSFPLERDGILGPESIEFRGLGFIRTNDGPEMWAAGSRGQIGKKTATRDWHLLENEGEDLNFPPRFEPCASSRNPGEPLTFNKEIWSMAVDGDYVYMGFENCTAAVAVRRDDQCVSMIPREGEPVAFEQSDPRSMVKRGRRLLMFLSNGNLYETTLP